MNINEYRESEIRINVNEEFKRILLSFFPKNHVCSRKIGSYISGAFPFEFIPTIQRHLKRRDATLAHEQIQKWLSENYLNKNISDVEKTFAEMQVRRLWDAINRLER